MSPTSSAGRSRPAALALAAAVGAAIAWAVAAAPAPAATYVPERGRIYHGVSDTGELPDYRDFKRQVRAHPAVLQEMYHWDVSLKASGAFRRWKRSETLAVVSMSTKYPATGNVEISPGQIASGRGDPYLLRLNEQIANYWKRPVLFRLFPEMNGHWNPYSAFDADGSRRDAAHSTREFKDAWRRFVMIVRGGARKKINHRLRQNGMPRMLRARSNDDPIYENKGIPRILSDTRTAFMWVPQSSGSPNVPGNQPRNYWPGGRFVDWVGLDIYSKFESAAFPAMRSFYRRWNGFPFVIGEYSPWDDDHDGSFTKRLFRWAQDHGRVRMLIYYRMTTSDNPHYISHYPGARSTLRRMLNRRRFDPYARQAR